VAAGMTGKAKPIVSILKKGGRPKTANPIAAMVVFESG
jgi:hypothetical protein